MNEIMEGNGGRERARNEGTWFLHRASIAIGSLLHYSLLLLSQIIALLHRSKRRRRICCNTDSKLFGESQH